MLHFSIESNNLAVIYSRFIQFYMPSIRYSVVEKSKNSFFLWIAHVFLATEKVEQAM